MRHQIADTAHFIPWNLPVGLLEFIRQMVCKFADLQNGHGNGLTQSSKGFVPVVKSVSHPPVRSVRFVQVEPRVRVTKQIESAMGKDGSVHCKFFQE